MNAFEQEVGYPCTTLPDMMMIHAGSGYGGHGTLCGALGGMSLIIHLVAYEQDSARYLELVDRLYYWYAEQEFPTGSTIFPPCPVRSGRRPCRRCAIPRSRSGP